MNYELLPLLFSYLRTFYVNTSPVYHSFHHLVGGVILDHFLVAALLLEPVHLDGGQAVVVHVGDVPPVWEELASHLDRLDGTRSVNINNCLLVSKQKSFMERIRLFLNGQYGQ